MSTFSIKCLSVLSAGGPSTTSSTASLIELEGVHAAQRAVSRPLRSSCPARAGRSSRAVGDGGGGKFLHAARRSNQEKYGRWGDYATWDHGPRRLTIIDEALAGVVEENQIRPTTSALPSVSSIPLSGLSESATGQQYASHAPPGHGRTSRAEGDAAARRNGRSVSANETALAVACGNGFLNGPRPLAGQRDA
jgi:hypothetical protein